MPVCAIRCQSRNDGVAGSDAPAVHAVVVASTSSLADTFARWSALSQNHAVDVTGRSTVSAASSTVTVIPLDSTPAALTSLIGTLDVVDWPTASAGIPKSDPAGNVTSGFVALRLPLIAGSAVVPMLRNVTVIEPGSPPSRTPSASQDPASASDVSVTAIGPPVR